jgi:hypothetical protein
VDQEYLVGYQEPVWIRTPQIELGLLGEFMDIIGYNTSERTSVAINDVLEDSLLLHNENIEEGS